MITVEDAQKRILETIHPFRLEKITLMDALGRVLGEDIFARVNLPPWNNSAMDGFAVRSEDTRAATAQTPLRFSVVEEVPAGNMPAKAIGPFEATRIMTGAPVPAGGDAVIRFEEVSEDGADVLIPFPVEAGRDIRLAGEDVRQGELVIPRGQLIRPAEIGMLASLGRSSFYVHQRPLVAILATGNEVVDIDEERAPWSIPSSNSYSLAAQVLECGALPLQLGIAKDLKTDIIDKFNAAARADVIVSTGGVSMGDYDLIREVIASEWDGIAFWQVAMKPGKPFVFGHIASKPFFGLPGNPVSSMISFEQFVRPALLKMMGRQDLFRRTVRATTREAIVKKQGIKHFLRARVTLENDVYSVTTTGDQGSGILKSMVRANALIILPEDFSRVEIGGEVTVQLLDNSLNQVPHS